MLTEEQRQFMFEEVSLEMIAAAEKINLAQRYQSLLIHKENALFKA